MTDPQTTQALAERLRETQAQMLRVADDWAQIVSLPNLQAEQRAMAALIGEAADALARPEAPQEAAPTLCPACKGEGQWAIYEGREHDSSSIDYCRACGGTGHAAPTPPPAERAQTDTFWEFVRSAQKEVRGWPAWKRGEESPDVKHALALCEEAERLN